MKDINNNNQKKTIYLVDPYRGGHHELYLSIYSKVLRSLGFKIIIITPPMADINATPLSLWESTALSVERIVTKDGKKPFLVIFLWLDNYLSPYLSSSLIEKTFPYNWFGLYFHPKHLRVRPRFNFFLRLLNPEIPLRSKYCKAVGVLDAGIVAKLQNRIQNKPVIVFPDVTDTSLELKQSLFVADIKKKAKGRKIIAVLGSIDKRKGIIQVLKLAHLSKSKNLFFVFIGKLYENTFSDSEIEFILKNVHAGRDNSFFSFDHVNSEKQFNSVLSICDIIYLSYLGFPHSSNLLTKAAYFKKPVIVSRGYYMEEVVKKYKLGTCINPNNITEASLAIKRILDNYENIQSKGMEEYYKANTINTLTKTFEGLFRLI